MQAITTNVPGNIITQKIRAVAEAIKNTGVLSSNTLMPISLVIAVIVPAVMFGTQMMNRLESVESRINTMESKAITQEVFDLHMKNLDLRLMSIQDAVGQKSKGK